MSAAWLLGMGASFGRLRSPPLIRRPGHGGQPTGRPGGCRDRDWPSAKPGRAARSDIALDDAVGDNAAGDLRASTSGDVALLFRMARVG